VLIDELHQQLARVGHPKARPIHGFALQCIGEDGVSTSELARRLAVSKQAAAKTVRNLEALDYVRRAPDPADARAFRLCRTARGKDLLLRSAQSFEELREGWSALLDEERLRALEADLTSMIDQAGGTRLGDIPGWIR
jgi:DNA-binding MarR family transcriptional regulator